MAICHCCGQDIQSRQTQQSRQDRSAPTIWVDEALLACCNLAHQEAERRGAAEVDIAHLIYVIATHRRHHHVLEPFALVPERLAAASDMALMSSQHARYGQSPRTSHDLSLLIDRTRQRAAAQRDTVATLADCVHAVVYDCGDLSSGRLVASWHLSARQDADRPDTDRRDWVPTGRDDRASVLPPHGAQRLLPSRTDIDLRPAARHATDDRVRYARDRAYDDDALAASDARIQPTHMRPDRFRPEWPRPAAASRHHQSPTVLTAADHERQRAHNELLERLARQERLLADLCARLANKTDVGANPTPAPRVAPRRNAANARATVAAKPAEPIAEATLPTRAIVQTSAATTASRPVRIKKQKRLNERLRQPRLLNWRRSNSAAQSLGVTDVASGSGADRKPLLSLVRHARPTDRAVVPYPSQPVEDDDEVIGLEDDVSDEVGDNGERQKRFYLALDDEIVRAPSIGPKTAARIIPHAIVRVGHLLKCDAHALAARVGARHITAQKVLAWQHQARLVCTIPWLRGTHAQLLVGAGYDSVEKIQHAVPMAVCAAIATFAATRDGQSILRAGAPPDADRITRWIAHAQLAETERAA
jgi:hypothetical protein